MPSSYQDCLSNLFATTERASPKNINASHEKKAVVACFGNLIVYIYIYELHMMERSTLQSGSAVSSRRYILHVWALSTGREGGWRLSFATDINVNNAKTTGKCVIRRSTVRAEHWCLLNGRMPLFLLMLARPGGILSLLIHEMNETKAVQTYEFTAKYVIQCDTLIGCWAKSTKEATRFAAINCDENKGYNN